VAGAAAPHPRGAGATRLSTKVVGTVAAGVISGSPAAFYFSKIPKVIVAAAAANHPCGPGANRLDAEVVLAMAAGVNRGSCA
jgi:hypothetical protein